jgi:protein ImuB
MRAVSERPRRYLAVWFPWLASDRRRPEASGAFVIVEKNKGALRLSAISPEAQAIGLTPGLTLADARARVPHMVTLVAEPEKDAALLKRVVVDFGRFTPMAAADGLDALILDVTGCAHLFGGEEGLVERALDRAAAIGLQARAAMAGTAQAARALVRFGPGGITPEGGDRAAVRRLPVEALELPEADTVALRRAGLKTVAAVDDRPRAALSARFGKASAWKVDRVLGLEDIRITPFRPPDPCVVDRVLMEPISLDDDIHRVLADLMAEAVVRLERNGQGGRIFQAAFFRVDGQVRRVPVQTGRATRDVATVLRLFRERIAALSVPLDPGFGFDQVRLSLVRTEPLAATQVDLNRRPDRSADFDGLVDRLSARLGPEAVLRFEPRDTHIPERAVRLSPAGGASALTWAARDIDETPIRPLHLFDPPQPVEQPMAFAPDGPPMRFRWRRMHHEVVRAEGPERIADEWWRREEPTRDYYRIEDRQGRRLWLFRQGLYGDEKPPRWFVHGLFA